jgi:hypothetical protein
MEEGGRGQEKEGKKNNGDPVIPPEETHRFLFNLFLGGSQPCGVFAGKNPIVVFANKKENPAGRHKNG